MLGKKGALVAATLAGALFTSSTYAQTITHSCAHDADLRVVWNQTPYLGTTYQLQSVRDAAGSSSTAGWRLHHRPVQNWPNHPYDPDTVITGSALLGYAVWDGLIPNVASGWAPPDDRLRTSILTCPDGMCTFSPHDGCKRTFTGGNAWGQKVALVGDSLIVGSELCVFDPDPNRICVTPASERLRHSGYQVWSTSGPGQGFVSWLDVIREQLSASPDIYILAFGTNDARNQASTPPANREARRWQTLGSVVASLNGFHAEKPGGCAVLVTVAENSVENGAFTPNYQLEAAAVNGLLRQLAGSSSYGQVELVEFANAARAHCPANWLSNPSVTCDWFTADQLHLTHLGDQARSDLIVDAVSRCAQ